MTRAVKIIVTWLVGTLVLVVIYLGCHPDWSFEEHQALDMASDKIIADKELIRGVTKNSSLKLTDYPIQVGCLISRYQSAKAKQFVFAYIPLAGVGRVGVVTVSSSADSMESSVGFVELEGYKETKFANAVANCGRG